MPTRTASVTGSIRNTGSTSVTLSLKFMFGTGSIDKTGIIVAPGALSSSITMSVSSDVPYGNTTSGILVLSRTTPNPQTSIASAGPWYYTEPHIYGSSLEGWGQSVAGVGAVLPRVNFLFEVNENDAGGWWKEGGEMNWPFLALGAAGLFVLWKMVQSRK